MAAASIRISCNICVNSIMTADQKTSSTLIPCCIFHTASCPWGPNNHMFGQDCGCGTGISLAGWATPCHLVLMNKSGRFEADSRVGMHARVVGRGQREHPGTNLGELGPGRNGAEASLGDANRNIMLRALVIMCFLSRW